MPNIALSALGLTKATTNSQGTVELATVAETTAGTRTDLACTPAGVAAVAIAGAPSASTTVAGIVELSTDAEAAAKTDAARAMTPSNVPSIMGAPGAIGGTTPAAGSFTTLTTTGAIASTGGQIVLGSDNAGNKVDIGLGTVARDINIANSAAAHTVGIGSDTGAAELVLKCGTGNFSLDGAATSTYTVGAATTSGTITIGGTAQTGTMTLGDSSGTNIVQIGSGEGATTVNIADGATSAKVVNVATGAVANVVTIGSVTTAAQLDLKCGTGNFSLNGAGASTYTVGAATTTGTIAVGGTAQTGTMTLGSSSGTNIVAVGAGAGATTVNIAGGATNAKAVNIATGAVANVVAIGSVTGAASMALRAGTGNFTLEGDVATTYAISNTGVNTGTVNIAGGTGARTVNLATGGTGVKTVNIATGASADVVSIGTVTGAASMALKCGTGNFTLEGNAASTYDISNTGINTGTVNIAGGTGARTVNLATGGTGAKTVNIATGTSADVVAIGTVTGAASMALKCGTGNFTLEGNVASTYEISSTGANTGTCKFASGTGARTVEIAGGGTGVKTINIGAAATADVITIGTTTGTGSLVLAAGTGDITLSGTVKEVAAEFVYASGTDLVISQSPIMQSSLNTGVAPTGATGDVNLMYMQDGCLMEQFILGAGQTIIAPRMAATTGLSISLDLTDNEGAEYNFGARANAKHAYTIGTSAAFFLEAQIYAADLSGLEPLWIGFRKVEANNAAWDSYDEFYGIGMNNATSGTDVSLTSRLNGGGVSLQSGGTAWTGGDGGTVTLKVLVSAAGVVTATIDGVAPASALAFTYTNAQVVMPCIHFLHDTATPGLIGLKSLKCGFQA